MGIIYNLHLMANSKAYESILDYLEKKHVDIHKHVEEESKHGNRGREAFRNTK